jgi:hypothetical protein
MSLPEPQARSLVRRESVGKAVVHVAAVLGLIGPILQWFGVGATAADAKQSSLVAPALWGIGLLLWIVGAGIEIFAAFSKESIAEAPDAVVACVYAFHATLIGQKGITIRQDGNCPLRVTIHRVTSKHEVVQLIDWVGDGTGGKGRSRTANGGVVGRALLTKQAAKMVRPKDMGFDAYVKEMVAHWHMPEAEARDLNPERYFFMAVPILQKGTQEPVGVVFLDADAPDLLTEPDEKAIVSACAGISHYLELRYGKGGP